MGKRDQNKILSASLPASPSLSGPDSYKRELPAAHCLSFTFSMVQNDCSTEKLRFKNNRGMADKDFIKGGCSGFSLPSFWVRYVYPAPMWATSSNVAESFQEEAIIRKNMPTNNINAQMLEVLFINCDYSTNKKLI